MFLHLLHWDPDKLFQTIFSRIFEWRIALGGRDNVSLQSKREGIIAALLRWKGVLTLQKCPVTALLVPGVPSWTNFPPMPKSTSNPSFSSMVRPLAARCSCSSDYPLSIKIALLSTGPALCNEPSCPLTLFMQQSYWNVCPFLLKLRFGRTWSSLSGTGIQLDMSACWPHALGRAVLHSGAGGSQFCISSLMLSWSGSSGTSLLSVGSKFSWLFHEAWIFRNPGLLVFINAPCCPPRGHTTIWEIATSQGD